MADKKVLFDVKHLRQYFPARGGKTERNTFFILLVVVMIIKRLI